MSIPIGPTSSSAFTIARSVAVITAIQYTEVIIESILYNVAGGYANIVARSVVMYLLFAAYSQGWISIPANLLLSA